MTSPRVPDFSATMLIDNAGRLVLHLRDDKPVTGRPGEYRGHAKGVHLTARGISAFRLDVTEGGLLIVEAEELSAVEAAHAGDGRLLDRFLGLPK